MLVFTRLFPYQLNTIGRDLDKSRKIATHFDTKIKALTKIYCKVEYTRNTIKCYLKFETNLEIPYCKQI